MSVSGGRVNSQARLARARSIISTSARPAGRPHPQEQEKEHSPKDVPEIRSSSNMDLHVNPNL